LQKVQTHGCPCPAALISATALGASAESHRRIDNTTLHSDCPRALLHIINLARDCGLHIHNIAAFSQWSRAACLVLLPSAAVLQCHLPQWPG
jgi:hypothetical protein